MNQSKAFEEWSKSFLSDENRSKLFGQNALSWDTAKLEAVRSGAQASFAAGWDAALAFAGIVVSNKCSIPVSVVLEELVRHDLGETLTKAEGRMKDPANHRKYEQVWCKQRDYDPMAPSLAAAANVIVAGIEELARCDTVTEPPGDSEEATMNEHVEAGLQRLVDSRPPILAAHSSADKDCDKCNGRGYCYADNDPFDVIICPQCREKGKSPQEWLNKVEQADESPVPPSLSEEWEAAYAMWTKAIAHYYRG